MPQEVQIKMNKDEINKSLQRQLQDGSIYNEFIDKPNGAKKQFKEGNTFYTVAVMKFWVLSFYMQVARLSRLFKKSNLKQTCFSIHKFLYNHIQYKIDDVIQNLRSPANTWDNRSEGIDCKSYSIIASCILTNLGIVHFIRQIKQAGFNPDKYSHVYIVVPIDQTGANLDKGYYTIDGTVNTTKEIFYTKNKDIIMAKLPHVGLNGPKPKRKATSKAKKTTTKKVVRKSKLMLFN